MIKVRLVPDFFFLPDDAMYNFVCERGDEENAFFIECELPCVPENDSVIGISCFREEIFRQYSIMLLSVDNRIHNAIKDIMENFDDVAHDKYEYLRKEYPGLAKSSDIEILRTVMYQECCYNVYDGEGSVRAFKATYIPNDENVYIHVAWIN